MNPLLARFADVPSLIEPSVSARFEAALHALARHERSDAMLSANGGDTDFWFAPDDWRAAYRPYVVRDGILQIPVKGVLLHDFPWAFGSYATGYLYILRALERGLADSNVTGIALLCYSYGGEGAGCFDTANKIFAARGIKPIRAFAEMAYSAGYAIASAADSITASSTSGVGSIGVVMTHMDFSRAMESAGVKVTFVHFGKHKVDGNSYEPLPADVKARWQGWCDDQGLQFCTLVARNRGLELKAVQDTEAGCYHSNEAKALGLIDAIAPLDDAVAQFNTDLSVPDDDEGETEMSTTTQTTATSQAALDTARTEGAAAGKLEGGKEGATLERARIQTILGCEEANGRATLAAHLAFETEMSADAAKAMLGKAAKETAPAPAKDALSTAMSNVNNPRVGADASEDQSDDAKATALAGNIVSSYLGKPAAA